MASSTKPTTFAAQAIARPCWKRSTQWVVSSGHHVAERWHVQCGKGGRPGRINVPFLSRPWSSVRMWTSLPPRETIALRMRPLIPSPPGGGCREVHVQYIANTSQIATTLRASVPRWVRSAQPSSEPAALSRLLRLQVLGMGSLYSTSTPARRLHSERRCTPWGRAWCWTHRRVLVVAKDNFDVKMVAPTAIANDQRPADGRRATLRYYQHGRKS